MKTTDPGGLPASVWLASEPDRPDLVVVGVPSSRSSLARSHTALAPLEMRQRLDRFSTFHGEMTVDLSAVPAIDVGNWPVSEVDPVPLVGELQRLADDLPEAGLRIYLGGDNAITRPLVTTQDDEPGKVGLITFDSHHDVGTLASGPSNRNPIRGLVEEHGLPPQNIVQIGIHSFANTASERQYCEDVGITTVTVGQVERIGMQAAVDVALSQLSATCHSIYVSVDLSVLDVALAPGCPGSRPGGLSIRQLSAGVARCAAHHSVRAMDLVEVDPTVDQNDLTLDNMAHVFLTAAAGYASR
jgi:arginase family enzyme